MRRRSSSAPPVLARRRKVADSSSLVERECPITRRNPSPKSRWTRRRGESGVDVYDAKAVAAFIVSTGDLRDPITRKEWSEEDLSSLDRKLGRVGRKDSLVKFAGEEAASVFSARREEESLLNWAEREMDSLLEGGRTDEGAEGVVQILLLLKERFPHEVKRQAERARKQFKHPLVGSVCSKLLDPPPRSVLSSRRRVAKRKNRAGQTNPRQETCLPKGWVACLLACLPTKMCTR